MNNAPCCRSAGVQYVAPLRWSATQTHQPAGGDFPGVWGALLADKACARALLAACAFFHTATIATPVDEWRDARWGELWRSTSGSAMALTEALRGRDSVGLVQNPLQRELLAVRARLEGLLGTRPSPVLLSYQASYCSLLACDTLQHLKAWQAQKRAGQGQPYLPPELLESLAAAASGVITVLALAAGPESLGGVAPDCQPQAIGSELPALATALHNLSAVCDELFAAIADEGDCFIGPAPLAATKAVDACLRLAAVLPEWLGAMQLGTAADTALADLLPLSPRIPRVLLAAAQLLASNTAKAIMLEGRVPSPALSAAAYNCAVSAAKVSQPPPCCQH